ncbi:MAG: chordopoxvirus fusion protein, partial [Candidatus Kryptonium sp.]|nr:chordopoxvirus fusion protein [Candidatus Kryptonium sp.]
MPKLGKTFKMTSTARKEIEKIIDERVKAAYVTKDDFNELKEIVKQLGEAQVNLTIRVSDLAEAQRKTEERLNTLTLRFDELTQKVSALADAQRKTEER